MVKMLCSEKRSWSTRFSYSIIILLFSICKLALIHFYIFIISQPPQPQQCCFLDYMPDWNHSKHWQPPTFFLFYADAESLISTNHTRVCKQKDGGSYATPKRMWLLKLQIYPPYSLLCLQLWPTVWH